MATRADLEKLFNGLPQDLSSLTEDELNSRMQQLRDLSGQPGMSGGSGIVDLITQRLSDSGVNPGDANSVARTVDEFIGRTGRAPSVLEFKGLLPNDWKTYNSKNAPLLNQIMGGGLTDEIQKGLNAGQFSDPRIGKTVADLQGLAGQKSQKRLQEQKITDSLAAMPAENEKNIGDFEKSLQESQGQFFGEQLAPQIIQNMNARGILHSGDLTDSLVTAGAGLQRDIKNTVAPIRLQASNDVTNKKYENVLRGALEQGQSLDSAINFSRNLYTQDQQNQFSASQAGIQRQFQADQMNQQQALQMAMQGGQHDPSAMDYFLQYGLPVLGSVAGGFAGGMGTSIASKMFSSAAGGAGANFMGQTLTNAGGGGARSSGFTPRNYSDYAGNWRKY